MGGVSGELYYVERGEGSELRYTYIEIFHWEVIVLPERVRIVCEHLGLDEDQLYSVH